ncbi:MAG TPA: hypothetical protein VGM80_04335 [Gaiellaceae bacterium]
MDVEMMAALETVRPVVAFQADWLEVLDEAGVARPVPVVRWPMRRRVRMAVPALAAIAAVVVAVTPALGLRGKLVSFFDLSRSAHVGDTWQQAGPRIHPTAALLAAARLTHVDPATLRRISAGGRGYRRVVLVGGIGPDGKAWLGQVGKDWVGDFFPLFGQIGEVDRSSWRTRTAHGWDGQHFPMYARSDGHRQVFGYVEFGGSEASRVSWATLVGFVRGDVTRLTVRTASGTTRRVPLTVDGGFSYAAVTPAGLPKRVSAYDAKGRLVGIQGFALEPLS